LQRAPLRLASIVALPVFISFARPHVGVSIASFPGALIFRSGLGYLPEEEWNLTISLPLRPVAEYGVDVLLAEVVELLESDILGQIL
jgi:hypothetical protein